ncbi:hypothetical protein V6N11_006954 [Hibiscus sabdariffa]|uniref:Uncharacterized protein n=1 Tax=Hibiscus sabdariffa TaxID=183260 RepID=A0ABR2RSU0_9ROSI
MYCANCVKSPDLEIPNFGGVLHKKTRSRMNRSLRLEMVGAARTQAPSATNYDVGSPTWGDLRAAPLPSAMEVTTLGHEPW